MRGHLKYWIGFNIVRGIGSARFQALLDYFGDLEPAWHAESEELARAGLDKRSIRSLLDERHRLDLDDELAKVEQAGATVYTWDHASYPSLLSHVHHPPPVLYIKGTLRPGDEWAVSIVGTRRATVYGREATRLLAGDLARNGVTVVSGLARGIDTHAHKAALDAGGRTIAVLGCGIDVTYPAENAKLAQSVVESGALVTEYALGTPPEGGNFPPRNRIISGLSLGTVIVEAGEGSGALITADFALDQGRDVFAVPGNIFHRGARGTNRLIQQGAKLVLAVEDILEELNLTMISQHQEVREIVPENETEAQLLTYISAEPVHIDEIQQGSGLPITTVSSTLALMELKGQIRQVGGMNYVLAREARAEYVVD